MLKKGKTYTDVRRLSADIQRKKLLAQKNERDAKLAEMDKLSHRAIEQQQRIEKKIMAGQRRRFSLPAGLNPLALSILLVLALVLIYFISPWGRPGTNAESPVTLSRPERELLSPESLDYHRASRYIDRVLSGKLVADNDIWHFASPPEVRYFGELLLSEIRNPDGIAMKQVYRHPGRRCLYCEYRWKGSERGGIQFVLAEEADRLKLVAVR